MMPDKSQPPADTELLRELGALLQQTESQGVKVQGNIEVAAARMQAVKSAMQILARLESSKREVMAGYSSRVQSLKEQIRLLSKAGAVYDDSELWPVITACNTLLLNKEVDSTEVDQIDQSIRYYQDLLLKLAAISPS